MGPGQIIWLNVFALALLFFEIAMGATNFTFYGSIAVLVLLISMDFYWYSKRPARKKTK